MEPSSLDKARVPQEHDLDARTRALEVKVGVQEQKIDDGFAALRELIDHKFNTTRAELELKLRTEVQASEGRLDGRLDRLEARMDAQFRLMLRLYVAHIALTMGLAAKLFWV